MAGEHILGWPIAVVRDRRVVADSVSSRLLPRADTQQGAGRSAAAQLRYDAAPPG